MSKFNPALLFNNLTGKEPKALVVESQVISRYDLADHVVHSDALNLDDYQSDISPGDVLFDSRFYSLEEVVELMELDVEQENSLRNEMRSRGATVIYYEY